MSNIKVYTRCIMKSVTKKNFIITGVRMMFKKYRSNWSSVFMWAVVVMSIVSAVEQTRNTYKYEKQNQEMDDRINGNWNETEEDLLLQKKFRSVFTENLKRLNLEKPLHGKIKARFGAKFLRENKNWIR